MSSAPAKSSRKPANKKSETSTAAPAKSAPVETAPVVEAPAVIAHVAEAPVAPVASVDDGASLVTEYNALQERVDALRTAVLAVVSDVRKIGRRVARVAKKADKRRSRKGGASAEGGEAKPKKESVFTRPNKITDELCVFLNKPKGTEMARSEVTREVIAYCKAKNLMEGQNIKTSDSALRKLLSLNESSPLSILTLQTHLKRHYVKTAPPAKA